MQVEDSLLLRVIAVYRANEKNTKVALKMQVEDLEGRLNCGDALFATITTDAYVACGLGKDDMSKGTILRVTDWSFVNKGTPLVILKRIANKRQRKTASAKPISTEPRPEMEKIPNMSADRTKTTQQL